MGKYTELDEAPVERAPEFTAEELQEIGEWEMRDNAGNHSWDRGTRKDRIVSARNASDYAPSYHCDFGPFIKTQP